MATELVEFRPGRWVKIVDGRTVGRATPEEVAAWQLAHGRGAVASNLDLDVDLSPGPVPGPAHAIDVPLRPAYERRGPRPEPGRPLGPEVDRDAPPVPAAQPFPPTPAQAAQPPKRRPPAAPGAGQPAPRSEPSALSARPAPPGRPAPAAPAADRPPARPAEAPSALGAPSAATAPAQGRHSSSRPATAMAPARPRRKAGDSDGASAKVPPRRRKVAGEGEGATALKAPASQSRASHDPAPTHAQPAPTAEATPPPEPDRGPRFWWIWNVHGHPVAAFLREWVPRYKAKFGREVSTVLCHADDLEAVVACGYQADVSPLLQPGHFYLGHEDE